MRKLVLVSISVLAVPILTACQVQSENTSSASSEAIASSTSSTFSTKEWILLQFKMEIFLAYQERGKIVQVLNLPLTKMVS